MLGIAGSDWVWGSSSHAWSDDSRDQVQRKAIHARLIRDISMP